MRTRKDETMDHFDLLPFIAILMCVLGVLLLVTVSMASIALGGSGEAWIPNADDQAKSDEDTVSESGLIPLSNDKNKNKKDARDTKKPKKRPILVEFDGKRAIFQFETGNEEASWAKYDSSDIESIVRRSRGAEENESHKITALQALIKKLDKDKQYALIAVRPSGFKDLQPFLNQFRRNDVTVGYEPIAQERPVKIIDPKDAKKAANPNEN